MQQNAPLTVVSCPAGTQNALYQSRLTAENGSVHIDKHSWPQGSHGGGEAKWSGSFYSTQMSLQLLLNLHSYYHLHIQVQVNIVRIDRLISMPGCCGGLHNVEEERDSELDIKTVQSPFKMIKEKHYK